MSEAQEWDDDGAWQDSLEEDRKSSQRSSGKKWGYMFRPNETPTKVHFTLPEKMYAHPKSGVKTPFRVGRNHWIPGAGKGKGLFVECGPECIVCAYSNPEQFGLGNTVKPSPQLAKFPSRLYYSVAGVIEEWFHLVEYFKNQEDEKAGTYHQRERCAGKGCQFCKDQWPKVFGKRFYMEINQAQFRLVFDPLHKQIKNSACKCGGRIFVTDFRCSKCDTIALDVSNTCENKGCEGAQVAINMETGMAQCTNCNTEWSADYTQHENILKECNKAQRCSSCAHEGHLKPMRVCSTEGCAVDPYGLFDAQLTINMTGSKKGERRLNILDWNIQDYDQRLYDPELQGADGEMAQKAAEAHAKPLDLEFLLKPKSADEQAKDLRRPNPFNARGGGQRFARYGEEEAGGEQGGEEGQEEAAAE